MSVPSGQRDETLPQSNAASNWTIRVTDVRTVKVSNISLAATAADIKEFFSFSGDIHYIEIRKESETSQVAYVTFKDSQGADTAVILSGATIADRTVIISPVEDYKLPPDALDTHMEPRTAGAGSAVRKAEDVVSTMLAKGYALGKDAINRTKSFDERIHLTSNASATVANLDRKMGLSQKLSMGTSVVNEKVREMDEQFKVYQKTKSALLVAEQKASDAGSAIMSNQYVSTAASWVKGALSAVAKAAEDVTTMTKEKLEKAEDNKREVLPKQATEIVVDDSTQTDALMSTSGEPPVSPANSAGNKITNI